MLVPVQELYLAVAGEDIVGALGCCKRLVPACVDELEGQFFDAAGTAVIVQTGKIGNVVSADI